MSSKPQLKKIHVLKNVLKLDDETYRDLLGQFKVKSSKDLTFGQAGLLIERLEKAAISSGVWEHKEPEHENNYNQLRKRKTGWQNLNNSE